MAVGVVVVGQGLEGRVHRLVALGPGAGESKMQERMPLTEATTGFSGSMARGSSTNFQVSPSLIISGIWRNEILAELACPAGPPAKITAFS